MVKVHNMNNLLKLSFIDSDFKYRRYFLYCLSVMYSNIKLQIDFCS